MKTLTLLLLPLLSFSQAKIAKGTNTIVVQGLAFNQVAEKLLDKGFMFDKIDSNYKTIKTEFKSGAGKNDEMKYRIVVRVKDSTATFTGDWYNNLLMGQKFFGYEFKIENDTDKIEYTSGNPKRCFNEMNEFVLSFNKPIEYSIVK